MRANLIHHALICNYFVAFIWEILVKQNCIEPVKIGMFEIFQTAWRFG